MFQDSLDQFALRDEMFSVEYFLTDREQTGVTDGSQKNVSCKDILELVVEFFSLQLNFSWTYNQSWGGTVPDKQFKT